MKIVAKNRLTLSRRLLAHDASRTHLQRNCRSGRWVGAVLDTIAGKNIIRIHLPPQQDTTDLSEARRKFAGSLQKASATNDTLTSLSLRGIYDSAKLLERRAMLSNTCLTFLGLAKHEMGYEGSRAISNSLKINTTLLSLDLSFDEDLDHRDNDSSYPDCLVIAGISEFLRSKSISMSLCFCALVYVCVVSLSLSLSGILSVLFPLSVCVSLSVSECACVC